MPKVPPAVAVQMPVGDLGPESPAHNVYWSVADGTKCKTLRNLWWLQLLKRQILTFLPNHWFGTERSEVRILSPRPININSRRLPPLAGNCQVKRQSAGYFGILDGCPGTLFNNRHRFPQA